MPDQILVEIRALVTDGLSWPDSPDFDNAINRLAEIPAADLTQAFENLLDDPDVPVALGIARAIGILKCSDAANLIAGLIDEPGKWFGHEDRKAISQAAIHSAGKIKASESLEALLFIVKTSRDPEILMEAVNSIGEIGSLDAVAPLLNEIETNPSIALSAAGALARIGGQDAMQGLLDCLTSDNEMVVSASVCALGKMGDQAALDPLMRLLRFSEPDIRADIAWAMGQIGGVKARITLAALSQGDDDIGVRREASRAIKSGAILGNKKNRE